MLLIESILICFTESRIKMFCTTDLVKWPSLKVGICACLAFFLIFLIRLNPTNSQETWLKASLFPPSSGCWWLLALSVPVFRCWCSCGGDENNSSTGTDNAEITFRPSRVSAVEMVLKTVQVCLYFLWNHCHQMVDKQLQHLHLRMSPGWASWEESRDEPIHLWWCVNAKGILLLRCAPQPCFQYSLKGCFLWTVFLQSACNGVLSQTPCPTESFQTLFLVVTFFFVYLYPCTIFL